MRKTGWGFSRTVGYIGWWRLGENSGDMPGLGAIGEMSGLYGLGAFGFPGDPWLAGAPIVP